MAGKGFDWKSVVGVVAPALASALGGPMAGSAVRVLGDVILGKQETNEQELETAIAAGLPVESLVKLREADANFKLQMRTLEIDLEKSYISDVQDARVQHKGEAVVLRVAIAVLAAFAVLSFLALGGSFYLLFNPIELNDGVLAAVFGLIGTVVGYAAGNAQAVVNYMFGTSRGSEAKNQTLSDAFKSLGAK